jgi:hypothetical protein
LCSDARALQLQLQEWYKRFKELIKEKVAEAVLTHYPSVRKAPSGQSGANATVAESVTDTGVVSPEVVTVDPDTELRLLRDKVAQQAKATDSLLVENFKLKLELSEMRDIQNSITTDVMTLTHGLSALLQGHAVYGERLANLEKLQGIRYGPNGEAVVGGGPQ